MSDDNKNNQKDSVIQENLWKILNRFDHLIESTNTKSALIIAFNTFVFGGIVLKWEDLLPSTPLCLVIIGIISLAAAAISSAVSLWFTLHAIRPFLESHNYHSNVFFKDIAEYKKPGDYLEKVKEMFPDFLTQDLAYQIHILSQGMAKKFNCLKKASQAIFYAQIPALVLFMVVKIIASVMGR
ncbi:MAG: hypothetical protein JSV88_07145 [Candidatus Aminicenantes bacterium]|nr:MAG: hypothetical protein JSV88_07145 [Candidatus Aminicenantes bacterium]